VIAYLVIAVVLLQGPVIAFTLAVKRDGSPLRKSFWT
jgi:hypothetical protein